MTRLPLPRVPLVLGLSLLGLTLVGCGEEVGRVACIEGEPLSGHARLTGGKPAALWTDFEAEYADGVTFEYDLTVKGPDGKKLTSCKADPANVNTRMNSYISDGGGRHSRRYLGKLDCDPIRAEADGQVDIEGEFRVNGTDASVARCQVVVRQ